MATKTQRYSAIAKELKCQQISGIPVKHEWLELITRLCRDNDPQLREIGINELRKCADNANHECNA